MKRIFGDFTRHTHPHSHPHTEGKLSFCGLSPKFCCEVQISKLNFCSVELDLHFMHTKTKLRLPKSLESRSSFHKRINNSEGHKIPTFAGCMRQRGFILHTYFIHPYKLGSPSPLSDGGSIQNGMGWIVERLSYQNSIWISIIVVRYKIQCMLRWMCALAVQCFWFGQWTKHCLSHYYIAAIVYAVELASSLCLAHTKYTQWNLSYICHVNTAWIDNN